MWWRVWGTYCVVVIAGVFWGAVTGQVEDDGNRIQEDPNLFESPKLLIVTRSKGIISYDPTDAIYSTIQEESPGFIPIDIDYFYSNKTLYWSDVQGQRVVTAPLQSPPAQPTELVPDLPSPQGVAVDWVHQNLHVVDNELKVIQVLRLDGSFRKTLVSTGLGEPRAIVVYPSAGWMFWSDWGEEPKIERCGMNGQRRSAIVTRNLKWPNGLALDYATERLYYADAGMDILASVTLSGEDFTVLLDRNSKLRHPFSLTLSSDHVFWSDWTNNAIFRTAKGGNSAGGDPEVTEVLKIHGQPMGIQMYSQDRQPESENQCPQVQCSHLCLPVPVYRRPVVECACPDLMVLVGGTRCSHEISGHLIFTGKSDVRIFDLETSVTTSIVKKKNNLRAVDFDYRNKMVYWADLGENKIFATNITSGQTRTVIADNLNTTDSLAVDWVSGHLFWTDGDLNVVEAAELDGSNRRVIIDDGLEEPRAIVLDPNEGWLYLSDWGSAYPKIEKASMAGEGRTVLVDTDIQWPNGLTIDYETRRLYWTDAKLKQIGSVGLNGEGRYIVLDRPDLLNHPYGITVFADKLYWTDWVRREVTSMSKYTRKGQERSGDIETVAGLSESPGEVVVFDISRQEEGVDRCASSNCTGLCLPAPRLKPTDPGYKCACPKNTSGSAWAVDCGDNVLQDASKVARLPSRTDDLEIESKNFPGGLDLSCLARNATSGDIVTLLKWNEISLQFEELATLNANEPSKVTKVKDIGVNHMQGSLVNSRDLELTLKWEAADGTSIVSAPGLYACVFTTPYRDPARVARNVTLTANFLLTLTLTQSLDDLEETLTLDLQGQKEALTSMNSSMQEDRKRWQEKAEELKVTLEKQDSSIDALEGRIDAMNRSQQNLSQAVQDQQEDLAEQEATLKSLQKSLSSQNEASLFYRKLMLLSQANAYRIYSTPVQGVQLFSSKAGFNTLDDAKASCAKAGGKLVELSPSSLMDASSLLKDNGMPSTWHWIGMTKQDGDGPWAFLSNGMAVGDVTFNEPVPAGARCARFLSAGYLSADMCNSRYKDSALCSL